MASVHLRLAVCAGAGMMPRQQAGQKGFTLVEMIIAITILGLTMALAYAALHVVNRTMSTVSVVQSDVEALRTTYHVLRHHLARSTTPDDKTTFRGQENSLTFFAPVPMRALGGGSLYRFYLHQKINQQSQNQLLLTYSSVDLQGEGKATTQVLAVLNGTLKFTYMADFSEISEGSWRNSWGSGNLPHLVRLQLISDSNEFWPEQVIQLHHAGT